MTGSGSLATEVKVRRSEINRVIEVSQRILMERGFSLPGLASWTPTDWWTKGEDALGILDRGMGWDVTDFGSGAFRAVGLALFTLRNGFSKGHTGVQGVGYAEKVMVVRDGQVTPMHFHGAKCEDIVNRSGGVLAVRLCAADDRDEFAKDPVTYASDGQMYTIPAGETVELRPGESLTLPPRLYHSFWAVGADVVAGEVSTVNDDVADNRFLEEIPRFPEIEEDEPPSRYVVADYGALKRSLLTKRASETG
jgi:D-lyxose ketol-isomerase